jgi:5'-nucleotidase
MKRIYIDMDGVLADFNNGAKKFFNENPNQKFPQSRYGFFIGLEEIPNAILSVKKIQEKYDVWILTRPSIKNINCYSEKAYWLVQRFGEDILNRTVMSCDKSIVKGDYLIDDQISDGQLEFEGKLLKFGSPEFPDWNSIINYLL